MKVKNQSESYMCKVKSLRISSEMTQKQFSDYFGIPLRTIEGWDSGSRKCHTYISDLIEYKLQNEGYLDKNKNRGG